MIVKSSKELDIFPSAAIFVDISTGSAWLVQKYLQSSLLTAYYI